MTPFDFSQRPFIIIWETTQACSLACRHCRASAELRRHPLELNTQEALRFIDQVVACQPALFVLTGGDPVRRSDLKELIRYATHRGLRVGLTPSATPELLREDFRDLKDAGVARLALSLDGASRESHDRFRGVPGTWDLTMGAVQKAREAGLPLQINTTFTRTNLGEFDAFLGVLDGIRLELWSVFQLVPTGRGKTDDLLTAEEMEALFLRLQRHSMTAPYDIKTTEGHHYRRVVVQQTRNTSSLRLRSPLGINDGKGFAFVSHIGDIYPSGFLPLRTGNVRTDDLLAVYRSHPMFLRLRDADELGGKCGRCEYRNLCGGSRARAYAMTGDYMAEEPLCVHQPIRGASPEVSIPVEARPRNVESLRLTPVSIQ
jgi:radical SAM protein with 4Fe4S-binding SPASM domain